MKNQGGTVFLIAGIILTGYLYVTGKLARVVDVIRDPGSSPNSNLRETIYNGGKVFPTVTPKDNPVGKRIDANDDNVYVNVKPKPGDDEPTEEQKKAAAKYGWPSKWKPKGFYVK